MRAGMYLLFVSLLRLSIKVTAPRPPPPPPPPGALQKLVTEFQCSVNCPICLKQWLLREPRKKKEKKNLLTHVSKCPWDLWAVAQTCQGHFWNYGVMNALGCEGLMFSAAPHDILINIKLQCCLFLTLRTGDHRSGLLQQADITMVTHAVQNCRKAICCCKNGLFVKIVTFMRTFDYFLPLVRWLRSPSLTTVSFRVPYRLFTRTYLRKIFDIIREIKMIIYSCCVGLFPLYIISS